MNKTTGRPRLTHSDFATYLAATWLLGGHERIPTGANMHESIARAFNARFGDLEKFYAASFVIRPNPIHCTSQTVADIFHCIYMLGLGYYRNPSDGFLHLQVRKEHAESIVADIPDGARVILTAIARDAINGCKPERLLA